MPRGRVAHLPRVREPVLEVWETREGMAPVPAAPARRLEGADALRAVATLAVVVIHTCHWPLQGDGTDQRLWSTVDTLSRFSVPAFVALSGLLLGLRPDAASRPRAFLRRRAQRTLLPFLAWAPVYCLFGLLVTTDIEPSRWGVLDWWSGGAGHLYFLLILPQLYAVVLLWPRRLRPCLWLAAAAIAVQIALEVVRLAAPLPHPLGTLLLWKGYLLFPLWIGDFAAGVATGRLLAARRDAGDHPRLALAFLAALPPALAALLAGPAGWMRYADFARGTGAFLVPALLPVVAALGGAVVLGAPALLRRVPPLRRPVHALSRDSLGVYITHPAIAYLLGHHLLLPYLQVHLPLSAAGFTLLTAGTLVLAVAATRLISVSPLAPLVGAERPSAQRRGEEGRQAAGRLAAVRRGGTRRPAG
jgi:surface polysaccharide O-acyltransferase-like enzyme